MSQSVDHPYSNLIRHNNTKAITNPLSLLIGLNNNNNNKRISDSDFVRSPKSPLELRVLSTMAFEPLFSLRSPRSSSLTAHLNCCCGLAKVGLSIVDSLGDDHVLAPDVVFGPALRIKEKHQKTVLIEKERSGVVFEIGENSSDNEPFLSNDCLRKTRVLSRSKMADAEGEIAFSGCVSEDDEMEMSEEYTCVITHGPNPKTTRIYGDRVLECHNKNESKRDRKATELDSMFPSDYFLGFCHFCNMKLNVGEDIYMYREKAFCSEECRVEEMMMIDEEDLEDSRTNL